MHSLLYLFASLFMLVIAVTDGRGNTTTFAYDALDRVIDRTNPAGNSWAFEYDARDLRTAVVKPDGTRIAFAYDDRGRLTGASVVGAPEASRGYAYDDEDNLVSAIAAAGTASETVWAFTYDVRDQLTGAARSAGPVAPAFSFTYEYDALGVCSLAKANRCLCVRWRRPLQTIAMRDSEGAVTSYLYDHADRLTGIVLPSGKQTSIAYDDAGRRTKIAFPNGLNTDAAFDTPASGGAETGRLLSIAHGLDNAGGGGSALHARLGRFAYSYDIKGNITGIAESSPRARNYALDAIERLTLVTDGAAATLESYTLDEEGNRVSSHVSSWHITDAANRVSEDEDHQFETGVNGNLVRKTLKSTGLTWRYQYSVYDELVSAALHDGPDAASPVRQRVDYVFDALGRRVAERTYDASGSLVSGATFSHDGEHLAHEAVLDGSGNQTSARWITHTDATDDLVSLTLAAGAGANAPTATVTGAAAPADSSFYYHTDHQGSVRAVTNDNGVVVNEYSYSAYGAAETAVETLASRFRFTAREYDADTGLMHYRARAYDPATGRFLQEDPLHFDGGDTNVYRYTWNNPLNWVDPSGLSPAAERGILDSIVTRVLLGGNIATRGMLSTGASTARYLKSADKNALSAIAAGIACAFFTIADAVATAGPGVEITGINGCGVVAMSVPPEDKDFPFIPVFPSPDQCTEIYILCQEGDWGGTKTCAQCNMECVSNKAWPYYACSPDLPRRYPRPRS